MTQTNRPTQAPYVAENTAYAPHKIVRNVPLAILGTIVSILYLANLTFGIVEIPDNLPIIGNLDEVFFSGVLFASLSRLGIRLPGYLDRTEKPKR